MVFRLLPIYNLTHSLTKSGHMKQDSHHKVFLTSALGTHSVLKKKQHISTTRIFLWSKHLDKLSLYGYCVWEADNVEKYISGYLLDWCDTRINVDNVLPLLPPTNQSFPFLLAPKDKIKYKRNKEALLQFKIIFNFWQIVLL